MSPGEMKKLIYMMVLLSTQTLTTLFFIASLPVIMEILDCVQKTSLLMNTFQNGSFNNPLLLSESTSIHVSSVSHHLITSDNYWNIY